MTLTTTDTTVESTAVWEKACPVDELEPSWGEALLLRMRQIALFVISPQEIYAVDHRDPATDAFVMARGIVGSKAVADEHRPTVASPLLKQVYDLGTGECFTDPTLFLQTYRTRVVGGFIEVEIEDVA
ncbi:nitrite reductase small subunit NirD [Conyzicola sp.]|uniref:nitrite reductase small subunit NirD n=1 Tax=Conyzicola sp. TaxID=1969404 RepID=UPI003988B447